MKKYIWYQVFATFCIGIFIVNFSVCLLAFDKSTYKKCAVETEMLTQNEAILVYEQLNDSFRSFFRSSYNIAGYELSGANKDALKDIKNIYRIAWIVSVLSFGGVIYFMNFISRRRMYMPLIYGGTLGAFLTAFFAFLLFRAKKGVGYGIKAMVLFGDYGFFRGNDVITHLFPDNFARTLAYKYVIIVGILIVIFAMVRLFIALNSRPHKF